MTAVEFDGQFHPFIRLDSKNRMAASDGVDGTRLVAPRRGRRNLCRVGRVGAGIMLAEKRAYLLPNQIRAQLVATGVKPAEHGPR